MATDGGLGDQLRRGRAKPETAAPAPDEDRWERTSIVVDKADYEVIRRRAFELRVPLSSVISALFRRYADADQAEQDAVADVARAIRRERRPPKS